ncbi:MAG: glycosyltransferase family 39 protein [Patescibacteria group bacterium]
MKSSKRIIFLFVALILSAMFWLEVSSATNESQTIDEGVHLSSGYAYLKDLNFELNPEHPPLSKYLAAIPLLFLDLDDKFDTDAYDDNQWEYARQLIHNNRVSNRLILGLGRLPTMLFSLLLGFIIFKFTRKYFNTKTAFLALILYAFNPNIIAHSRYVTTDIPITFFIFLTIYLWLNYLKKSNWKNLVYVALAFAGASLTKFSSVILIPILITLFLIYYPPSRFSFKKFFGAFALIFIITYFLIISFYGFELKTTIEDPLVSDYYQNLPHWLDEEYLEQQNSFPRFWYKQTDPEKLIGKFIKWFSHEVPVPGFSYFKGFYLLARHNHFGHTSYLLGQHSDFGWWYYFPIAFLVKTPIAITLLIIFSTVFLFLRGVNRTKDKLKGTTQKLVTKIKSFLDLVPFVYWALFISITFYFGWTLSSKLNIGIRHLLPIFPFIFIFIALFLGRLLKNQKILTGIAALLCIQLLISSFWIYPHYLSYFQELVGGPQRGHRYLTDSNIDWGQGLIQLKNYMDANGLDSIYLHYFGSVDPRSYDVNWESPPNNQEIATLPDWHGHIAISVTALLSKEKEFSWLEQYQPIATISHSIWIYQI